MRMQSAMIPASISALMPALIAAIMVGSAGSSEALEFQFAAEQVTVGEFTVEKITVQDFTSGEFAADPNPVDEDISWQRDIPSRLGVHAFIGGVSHPRLGRVGNLELSCGPDAAERCSEITGHWDFNGKTLTDLNLVRAGRDARGRLTFPDLTGLPSTMLEAAGVGFLEGSTTIDLVWSGSQMDAMLHTTALGFDTPAGIYAGAGIEFESEMLWRPGLELALNLDWTSGELLLGPAYVPPPQTPWSVRLKLQHRDRQGYFTGTLQVTHAETLNASFAGEIDFAGKKDSAAANEQAMLISGTVDVEQLDLAWGWRSGLGDWVSSYGWDGFSPAGHLQLQGRVADGELRSVSATLTEAELSDSRGRLELSGLNSSLMWTHDEARLGLSWSSLSLFRFGSGAAEMQLVEDNQGTLALTSPLAIPILDGAVVVEKLRWLNWRGSNSDLQVATRVEPIDLARLTRRLGLTELGGSLSGRIPALHWRDEILSLEGGLELELFGGHARIDRLELERPLGSLPALSADIEFDRLNLAPATQAFEFGAMTGLLSGYMRDLRLLDWQPVKFDAWFETLEDSPSREISQKAVNSLSSVSGGGSAALSGTVLRWFDTFPYARIGIGCRLERNVCTMRGLGPAQPSGYRILDGRLLPRLDIVAHKREVDWPRLVAQLKAATESGPATTSDKLQQSPGQ